MDTLSEDAAGLIEALDLGRVTFVGNSMGGMIAAMLAATHPDLVTRLVLVDPVLPLLASLAEFDRIIESA